MNIESSMLSESSNTDPLSWLDLLVKFDGYCCAIEDEVSSMKCGINIKKRITRGFRTLAIGSRGKNLCVNQWVLVCM